MIAPAHLDLTDTGILLPLLQRHGFILKKGLGQHFLISRKALEAIITACELEESAPILEIGPGIGTVTRRLAECGARVTAVELDSRAIFVLHETVGEFPRIRLVQGNILTLNLAELLSGHRWTVVGNLPYYITTPVISRLLEIPEQITRMVLMVQQEVSERLRAAAGTRQYGALSVFVQTFAEVERVLRVPPGAFIPPPAVTSELVRLTMRQQPLVPAGLQETFFRIVRAAFGQRRKTLENALVGGGILDGKQAAVHDLLLAVEIDPRRRGETLTIAEYLRIAEKIDQWVSFI